MNPSINEQPLTLSLSPYEGERGTVSLVVEHSSGHGLRSSQENFGI
jgi:hypothetical protein